MKKPQSGSYVPDSGLHALMLLGQFHDIHLDVSTMRHQAGLGAEKATERDIVLAARRNGMAARHVQVTWKQLTKMPAPNIGLDSEGRFFLILKVDEQGVLIAPPYRNTPKYIEKEAFLRLWTGGVIVAKKRFSLRQPQTFGVRWFIPSIIKYKKPLLEVLVAAFSLQILGLVAPVLTQVIIDKALSHQGFSTLDVLLFALVIVAIFELLMGLAKQYIFTHTTSKIDVTLGAKVFGHLFSLPMRYFESRRVGDTVARVRELESIRNFLTGAPLTSILDVLFIVVYIGIMLWYSVEMTWIVLATLPLFALLSAIVSPLLRKRLDEKFDTGAESQSFLVESVTGAQTIKSFALEPTRQKRWEETLAQYVKAGFRAAMVGGTASQTAQFIQKIADLGILWLGAHLVIDGQITIGALVAFRMLAGKVSTPVLRLVQMWQDIQQTGISIKRLGDIFNTPAERASMGVSRVQPSAVKGDVVFDAVHFRYRADGAEVIRGATFSVEAGSVVGVVGKSGSGKSTLAKLLQRLYVPEAGTVRIDGMDTALADPTWLRRTIGVVSQDTFLFNASVRENIAVHMPGASMDAIIEVSKIAGAHEFILQLPEGYDTVVGERGEALSGGQRQRIAIARALLHNPRILVFDEATSALDYESEAIIQANLQKICAGRTVFIIAHRLSTLKDVQYIMSVDAGAVVQFGSRREIARQEGVYATLLQQQGGSI